MGKGTHKGCPYKMIRKLSPELVREIAAGEVVTGPVDVLKELVDNALDAGATRLEIELESGGVEKIVVADNGVGISKEDLPLAAEQHSTSKLESLNAIKTLGFRGEGLYALRYAARLRVTSRTDAQLGGATLNAEGDDLSLDDHPAPKGTRAEVTRLFNRLPARRAVLEHPSDELRKTTTLLQRYLLHHPSLKMRLLSDGNERWHYAGGSFSEAVKFAWGGVTANRLLNIRAEDDTKALNLTGLISRPELTRPRRDRLLLAVNGRPVIWEERWLKHVFAAYREMLKSGHYPVGVLNLALPADAVLVNTSPDKSRVRFLEEEVVLQFLQESISSSLAEHPLAPPLPSFEPSEGVAPAPRHSFPKLEHVGTYRELYLLAEASEQLWVIDQHAAHERILFEELERRYRSELPIELDYAELIPLSQEESEGYLARREDLGKLGLVLEPFGGDKWRVRSLPAFLTAQSHLVGDFVKGTLGGATVSEAWRKVLSRLACLPAIKAGHHLARAQAQTLLDELGKCETPWACPHGRPTALVLSEFELARRFGRGGVRSPNKVTT